MYSPIYILKMSRIYKPHYLSKSQRTITREQKGRAENLMQRETIESQAVKTHFYFRRRLKDEFLPV